MEYGPVKKICFAFDNKHTGNDIAFSQLTSLVTAMGAELHVLYMRSNTHGMDVNTDIDQDAKKKLSTVNVQYHIVPDVKDIDSAIINFVEQNKMDWLVMIPRKHSFFEGLFYKSHTKTAAQNAHLPIVALHEHV
jgi:nucleotide-binding universal stress UspA family protein